VLRSNNRISRKYRPSRPSTYCSGPVRISDHPRPDFLILLILAVLNFSSSCIPPYSKNEAHPLALELFDHHAGDCGCGLLMEDVDVEGGR
jgi:hypothetical protein